ncbi:MAG TPA: VWA domain-containing protein [Rhizomicrobium sp.]|nr:VWA domain-containing protein [Rhizomicrobium sp.]
MNEFLSHPSWKAFVALASTAVPKIGFLWPEFLWGLILVPVAVAAYVLLLRRRKQGALRYGAMALVKQAMAVNGWRRHIPPALMLGALTLLLVAMARPTALVSLPSTRATVILAMDVSGSMRSSDVNPSRIEAAQAAAKQYIKDQPKDVQIGIVAFAATALLVQNPTTDRVSLNAAIDRFELQRGTAVGSGILVSLQTLFPQEDFPINNFAQGNGRGFGNPDFSQRFGGRALGDRRGPPNKKEHVPVEPGSYKNAVVILLTDGATNAGYDPVEAARIASNYGGQGLHRGLRHHPRRDCRFRRFLHARHHG